MVKLIVFNLDLTLRTVPLFFIPTLENMRTSQTSLFCAVYNQVVPNTRLMVEGNVPHTTMLCGGGDVVRKGASEQLTRMTSIHAVLQPTSVV